MADLPDELIIKILGRLPKESLLRFRCVSKSWRRTIDIRFFGKSFLFLFGMNSPTVYLIDLRLGELETIENPLEWGRVTLLGSWHRYLCIANVHNGEVAIWGPFALNFWREGFRGWHRVLPRANIPHRLRLSVYGFGFDIRNDEFVLLSMVQRFRRPISEVSIYKSNVDEWRRLQQMPPFLVEPGSMGAFVCGRLHWIMRRNCVQNSAKVLVAFDIRTENFVELDLPNDIDNRLRMDLTVLEGRLCLTIYAKQRVVWIMREYGSKESWHRLFSLRDDQWRLEPIRPIPIRPLAYLRNGQQVLVEVGSATKTLGLYNLRTNETEQFFMDNMPNHFHAATCFV